MGIVDRLPLVADTHEISAILASQIKSRYRFVHDALKPFVRVEPLAPGDVVIIEAGARLSLRGRAPSCASPAPVTFAVIFDVRGIRLLEVSAPDARVLPNRPQRTIPLETPTVEMMPEGGQPLPTRLDLAPRQRSTRAAPQPVRLVSAPEPAVVPIQACWQALCAAADVHPELGDYLVMPLPGLDAHGEIPKWIVGTAHVSEVHAIKPRLGTDDVVIDEPYPMQH